MDTFAPVYVIEINGKKLSKDITEQIISFSYEESEEEMDLLEIVINDEYLQYIDDPLFQEDNEIKFRFGYVDNLSEMYTAVIKDIEYDFPDGDVPKITIKAYDKACGLTGQEIQKVWSKPSPGIRYSEIAEALAEKHKLKAVVTATKGRHLRVPQNNVSDAKFLKELAKNSVSSDGKAGYVFYVENNELHFHPRRLDQKPSATLTYYTSGDGTLRSFKPTTNKQETTKKAKTKTVGVDPRAKATTSHVASNETTPNRDVLGSKTLHNDTFTVDANSGRGSYGNGK